jgi:hypothetical protein
VHPIERLRYVARSHGGDQRLLVRETAGALRGLGLDPAGLVVACRRIVERHPTSGPLWWLCSSVLAAPDPFSAAARLADSIEEDPTPEVLIDALPADAVVTLLGWPDLAGESVLRRGDITVLAIDVGGEGASFVRRLERKDVEAEVVDPAGIGGAVAASDLVLIEALAATPNEVLAVQGSRSAASVAYCSEVPVWLVAGRGRCLPEQMFATVIERAGAEADAPWRTDTEPMPVALFSHIARDGAVVDVGEARAVLGPECPLAHELLRMSPM